MSHLTVHVSREMPDVTPCHASPPQGVSTTVPRSEESHNQGSRVKSYGVFLCPGKPRGTKETIALRLVVYSHFVYCIRGNHLSNITCLTQVFFKSSCFGSPRCGPRSLAWRLPPRWSPGRSPRWPAPRRRRRPTGVPSRARSRCPSSSRPPMTISVTSTSHYYYYYYYYYCYYYYYYCY